jgi:hypothetical protein
MKDTMIDSLLTYKPYTIKRDGVWRWGWLFTSPAYWIMFEDTKIRQAFRRDEAEDLVMLLNAAWQLGAGTGYIQGQFSKQDEPKITERRTGSRRAND